MDAIAFADADVAFEMSAADVCPPRAFPKLTGLVGESSPLLSEIKPNVVGVLLSCLLPWSVLPSPVDAEPLPGSLDACSRDVLRASLFTASTFGASVFAVSIFVLSIFAASIFAPSIFELSILALSIGDCETFAA
jgi:hypothetical protein